MYLRGIGSTHVQRRFIEQLWLTVMKDFSYTLAQYPRMELESEDPGVRGWEMREWGLMV